MGSFGIIEPSAESKLTTTQIAVAEAAPQIDYWITTDDNPTEILRTMPMLQATPPCFPSGHQVSGSAIGYASQEELYL